MSLLKPFAYVPRNLREWTTWIEEQNNSSENRTLITQTVDSAYIQELLDISNFGWMMNLTFSASSATEVAWTAGELTTAAGRVYNLNSGSTGTMSARTFIYLDVNESEEQLSISTTAGDAVGYGKIMVAVAQNTTSEAFFQVFGGLGGVLVTANEIAANTITANEIAAGTITAAEIEALSITADEIASGAIVASKLAATLLYAGEIELDAAGHIRSGQTAYNTGTGFWLGQDGTTPKFSIGDPAGQSLKWDGTNLSITGAISVTSPIPYTDVSGLGSLATQSSVAYATDITGTPTLGALAAADSVAYGDVTGTKPPTDADHTSTIIDGGLITTGYITLGAAGNIKSGQTAYNTGTGFWLGQDGTTPKFSIGNPATKSLTWDGTDLSINGSIVAYADLTGTKPPTDADHTAGIIDAGLITTGYITLSTAGNIKSRQTAYNTGTGFWLGKDGTTPKFSIGNSSDNYLSWDGSELTVRGDVSIGSYTASTTDVLLSAPTERNSSSEFSYTEVKKFAINKPGTVNVYWQDKLSNISTTLDTPGYVRVKLDGVVQGTAQGVSSLTYSSGSQAVTTTETSQYITIEIQAGQRTFGGEPLPAPIFIKDAEIRAVIEFGESVITD